ncbi:hypothetical protein BC830DRAFT_1133364 [Chytriomyces sp. MP71]|nr:hypothetical protein BC830DRAFT_1133364 [Chytriomyces sp. MP71]
MPGSPSGSVASRGSSNSTLQSVQSAQSVPSGGYGASKGGYFPRARGHHFGGGSAEESSAEDDDDSSSEAPTEIDIDALSDDTTLRGSPRMSTQSEKTQPAVSTADDIVSMYDYTLVDVPGSRPGPPQPQPQLLPPPGSVSYRPIISPQAQNSHRGSIIFSNKAQDSASRPASFLALAANGTGVSLTRRSPTSSTIMSTRPSSVLPSAIRNMQQRASILSHPQQQLQLITPPTRGSSATSHLPQISRTTSNRPTFSTTTLHTPHTPAPDKIVKPVFIKSVCIRCFIHHQNVSSIDPTLQDPRPRFVIDFIRAQGTHCTILRTHEEFWALHVALLAHFPAESGRMMAHYGIPHARRIPFMPTPSDQYGASGGLAALRRLQDALDVYLRMLVALPPQVSSSAVVAKFFHDLAGVVDAPGAVGSTMMDGLRGGGGRGPWDDVDNESTEDETTVTHLKGHVRMGVVLLERRAFTSFQIPRAVRHKELLVMITERMGAVPAVSGLEYEDESGVRVPLVDDSDLKLLILSRHDDLIFYAK